MLRELNIENVAVIERASVQFGAGLNVLTGETGAGKSILIDSINAILGNRTTREIVRTGEERAIIWAAFSDVDEKFASSVRDKGYECDDALILHREITADGKSQCRINGRPATAATVREVCEKLINIHGQHDNQDLLNPEKHIDIIDAYADLASELADYQQRYSELITIKREIESLNTDDEQKARRTELLSYEIDEIDKAKLEPGEEEELTARRNLIRNSERILEAVSVAHAQLSGDGDDSGALARIFEASRSLVEVDGVDAAVDALRARADELYYQLNDVSSELGDWLSAFEYDPGELESIEERLDVIFKLKTKYGADIAAVLEYRDKSAKELSEINRSDERMAELKARWGELLADVKAHAQSIEDKRRAALKEFERRIKEELEFLNMPGVSFVVNCEETKLGRKGKNAIEFLVSANTGEPAKPLARIASGGELSRIMLSVKNVLAERDDIGTLIFDEIDTGVSGSSAGRIGQKLKESSRSRQTICVTHSAQIASYADEHLLIEKQVRDGRTYTDVRALNDEQRKAELARIISGDSVTEISLKNAAEMLEIARA